MKYESSITIPAMAAVSEGTIRDDALVTAAKWCRRNEQKLTSVSIVRRRVQVKQVSGVEESADEYAVVGESIDHKWVTPESVLAPMFEALVFLDA